MVSVTAFYIANRQALDSAKETAEAQRQVAEAQRQRFAEHTDLFTRYLPHAVALGIAHEWARRFDLAGTVYSRAWYEPVGSAEIDDGTSGSTLVTLQFPSPVRARWPHT